MSAIELHDLRVVYRRKGEHDRVALDGVSLESDNEMLALLGPNGAGKSTLMGVIAQTIRPDSGERRTPTSRKGLSVVFQTPSLDLLLTVRENLRLSGALHGIAKAEADERIRDIATELSITDRLDEQVRHLSGGLARRADLARALVPRPTVLLLDEPTTGLDIDARRSFWDSMERIRKRHGMCVLLATHLIEEAERSDRVAMLSDGRLVELDTPSRFRASLGSRVLRVAAADGESIHAVDRWLKSMNREVFRIDSGLIVPDAEDVDLQSCPIDQVSLTLAPPTLEDAYAIRTTTGAIS
ncbi:MAG: ABC transporter ATP-binding protein [Phycisphaerales bacterium]|nr:ABC transporter ATP-binding protein [Phycisphaerales bacterium]